MELDTKQQLIGFAQMNLQTQLTGGLALLKVFYVKSEGHSIRTLALYALRTSQTCTQSSMLQIMQSWAEARAYEALGTAPV